MKRNDFMRFQDRSDVDGPYGNASSSDTEDYEAQEVHPSSRPLKQHSLRAKQGENEDEEDDDMNDSQMILLN